MFLVFLYKVSKPSYGGIVCVSCPFLVLLCFLASRCLALFFATTSSWRNGCSNLSRMLPLTLDGGAELSLWPLTSAFLSLIYIWSPTIGASRLPQILILPCWYDMRGGSTASKSQRRTTPTSFN